MKVYILDNGYLSCDKNWIVCMNTYATNDQRNPANIWSRMPVYCVLIDHPSGKYLYDAGCDQNINEFMKSIGRHQFYSFPYHCTQKQTLQHQLALCNTKPSDINGIILSHLHYDHVGNLPLFQNIDVYVPEDDYYFALNKGASHLYFDKYIKEPDVNYIPISKSFTLAQGIDVIHFGSSHCPSLLGLLLHLDEGNLLFPSDVLYTKENFGPPLRPRGKEYDTLGFVKVSKIIQKLSKAYNAKIMYPHDINEFRFYKKAPYYYE